MSLTGRPHWMRLDLDVESAFEAMRSDARHLWETCFDDEERFVDFYFDWVYDPEEIYMHYDEAGEPSSHIHAIVYALSVGQGREPLPVSYVSGACTMPEARGRGQMRELMRHMFAEERRFGRVASVLIPADEALRSYYARHFGYETVSYRYETSDPKGYVEACPERMGETDALGLDLIAPEGWHLVSDWSKMGALLEEYTLGGWDKGGYQLIPEHEGTTSLAFYRLSDTVCHIDAIWGTRAAVRYAIEDLRTKGGEDRQLCLRTPLGVGGYERRTPLAMIRPLSLLPFLELYAEAHPEVEQTIYVQDELLPENTGSYELKGGSACHDAQSTEGEVLSLPAFVARFVPEIDVNLVHD